MKPGDLVAWSIAVLEGPGGPVRHAVQRGTLVELGRSAVVEYFDVAENKMTRLVIEKNRLWKVTQ